MKREVLPQKNRERYIFTLDEERDFLTMRAGMKRFGVVKEKPVDNGYCFEFRRLMFNTFYYIGEDGTTEIPLERCEQILSRMANRHLFGKEVWIEDCDALMIELPIRIRDEDSFYIVLADEKLTKQNLSRIKKNSFVETFRVMVNCETLEAKWLEG
jgi:hypothetical protein